MKSYSYRTVTPGADPGFDGSETFTNLRALFKKMDIKLWI